MADKTTTLIDPQAGTRGAAWGLGGLIVGYLFASGRNANIFGVNNAACAAVPPVVGFAGYPGYGGYPYPIVNQHESEQFIVNRDQEKRLARLEAFEAATAVAVRKDAELGAVRDELNKEIMNGNIYRATCMKIDGEVKATPRVLCNPYRGEEQVLESHSHYHGRRGGCGCDTSWGW